MEHEREVAGAGIISLSCVKQIFKNGNPPVLSTLPTTPSHFRVQGKEMMAKKSNVICSWTCKRTLNSLQVLAICPFYSKIKESIGDADFNNDIVQVQSFLG